jgi:uncharacterized protein YkwD
MRDASYRLCLIVWAALGLACPAPSSSREESANRSADSVSPATPAARNAARPRSLPQTALAREEMILAINAERTRAGVSPLRSHPALDRVAQERADEIAQRGALPDESPRLMGVLQRRLVKAGYPAHGWVESIVSSEGDVGEVIGFWRGEASYAEILRADYSDLGLGVARLGDVPLYLVLAAWPETEVYAREVRELTDLAAVRAEMLAGVNRLRAKAGLAPLVEDSRLDAAAQEHAEDMLARDYYGHKSPEGKEVGDRLRAEGYVWQLAAENIAAGHMSVESVLDAWMDSSGHRANLLRKNVTDFGFGLAIGPYNSRYRVFWVQNFGAPRSGSAQ